MQKYLWQLTLGFMVLVLGMVFITAGLASAGLADTACEGFQQALGGGGGCAEEGGEQINTTLETVVDILSVVVAIISVIMIIIAGIRYVTSGGDPGATKGAKDTIIYAVVGLVIVALAQSIVKFVIGQLQ